MVSSVINNTLLKEDFAAYQYVANMFDLQQYQTAEEYYFSKSFRKSIVPFSLMYNLDTKCIQSYIFRFLLRDRISYAAQILPTHAVKIQNGVVTEYYEARAISNIERGKEEELSIVCVTFTLDRKTPLEYYLLDREERKEYKFEYGTNKLLQTNVFSSLFELDVETQQHIEELQTTKGILFFMHSQKPYGRIVEFNVPPDYIG